MIASIRVLLHDIQEQMELDDAVLEVYDTSGHRYNLVEVYQSDEGPGIICFDVEKVEGE